MRSTTSSSCSRPTGTTRSRRSPRSRGSRTTRSAWSASPTRRSASCSSRSSSRRTSPRSRRLSVIDDTIRGTLDPGGVLNSGFAVGWAKERQQRRQACGPGGGQSWATDRIKGGDKTCLANQALHSQAPDIIQQIKTQNYWTDAIGLPLSPEHFVNKINVPTFFAGDWQDEQTGGYFANLLEPVHRYEASVVHRAERQPHRSVRPGGASRVGCSSSRSSSRRRSRTRPRSRSVVADTVANMAFGVTRAAAARPVRERHVVRAGEADLRELPARCACCSRTAAAPTRARPPRVSKPTIRRGRSRTRPRPGTSTRTARSSDAAPAASGADSYVYDPSHQHDTTIANADTAATWVQAAEVLVERARGRHRACLRDRAARPRRDRDRRLERRPVAEVDRDRHRHAGDDHRGAARRPGGLRAERVAARERSCAPARCDRAAPDAPAHARPPCSCCRAASS